MLPQKLLLILNFSPFRLYYIVTYIHICIQVWLHFIVIEAQVPTEETLRSKTSIQFPSVTNMSNDVTMVFGNMTPMIEIPSNIVLRQLEEGMVHYV